MFNKLAIICALAVVAKCQLESTPLPWLGPFADHKLGELVQDTPAVALAKKAHAEAHAEVRAILPELPFEEKFPTGVQTLPVQVLPERPVAVPVFSFPANLPFFHVPAPQAPVLPTETALPFAENVPLSKLGETPEVAQARSLHLQAVAEARAALPKLEHTIQTHPNLANLVSSHHAIVRPIPEVHHSIVQPVARQLNFVPAPLGPDGQVVDTAEIMLLKQEHLRAVQEALRA